MFGAARSLDWKGRRENRSPGSSLREKSGGRVTLSVRGDAGTRVLLNIFGETWGNSVPAQDDTRLPFRSRRQVGVNRECSGENSCIKHPTPFSTSHPSSPSAFPSTSPAYPLALVTARALSDVVDAPAVDQALCVPACPVNPSDFIFTPESAHLAGSLISYNPVLVLAPGIFYCLFRAYLLR